MNAVIKRSHNHYSYQRSQRWYHWSCDKWCDRWSCMESCARYPREMLCFGLSFQKYRTRCLNENSWTLPSCFIMVMKITLFIWLPVWLHFRSSSRILLVFLFHPISSSQWYFHNQYHHYYLHSSFNCNWSLLVVTCISLSDNNTFRISPHVSTCTCTHSMWSVDLVFLQNQAKA